MNFNELLVQLEGDLYTDEVQRLLYSTDASQYREVPLAVTRPKSREDLVKIINFARENKSSVIPRGGGTSLAGQVVGPGIVVDISKYMNRILEFSKEENYVVVEPGVVLAELNMFLAEHGLQFGPETSTANRCVIGGMLGNNACGLHSLAYGSVREHVLEVDAILSDGSETTFKPLTREEFRSKLNGNTNLLEKNIYKHLNEILSDTGNQQEIREKFPDPKVSRRNMGYAVDVLLDSEVFTDGGEKFNFCKLLAGSEGTLAFSYRIKLNVIPLPPKHKGLVCAHFRTLEESLQGNLIALKYHPTAIELMDDAIMQCTKANPSQRRNRFFVEGDPGAMLMIEFSFNTEKELTDIAAALEEDMRAAGLGYHFPLVTGSENIKRVWALRTAGLGLLANLPGDRRGVPGIEDTAVQPEFLPDYVADIKSVLSRLGLESIFYAHIATGEIHFRPLINFKDPADVDRFEVLMNDVAALVKKYRGSMSGEHGDGRVRGKFIPFMLGEKNYALLKSLKQAWDPHNVFNPGKIIDTPPITESLRVVPGETTLSLDTLFDFSTQGGYVRSVEKCNGSGDCRKSAMAGGTMCPSYMASLDERNSTRARANVLREYLRKPFKANRFNHKEIYGVMDLCLSCKACKSECPSNVDITKLKAEFLQAYYDSNGIPLRTRMIAYFPRLNKIASIAPSVYNFIFSSPLTSSLVKGLSGFARERSVPLLHKQTFQRWYRSHNKSRSPAGKMKGKVYLFNDEFTNFNDTPVGIKTVGLLEKLGYEVEIPGHLESGRTFLSKGLVRKAKALAEENVSRLKELITPESPLLGIEPSAILTFRDEYIELVPETMREEAGRLSRNVLLLDEFIDREAEKGNITAEQFVDDKQKILLHGHCYQKALASNQPTMRMLSLPKNFEVEEIPSGCCGMAGAFGYEKEHYSISITIGEMVLFPAIRRKAESTIVTAPGTSCRHQIKDGTNVIALHPAEILYNALKQQ